MRRKYRTEIDPEEIISHITNIRRQNNHLWMDLLRLAFTHAPQEARYIMKKITKNDREVSKWTNRL